MLQLLYTVTALQKLNTMAKFSKMPKKALVYSKLTHCNNNLTANYTLKEKRLTVNSTLEKRALDNYYLN